MVFMQVDIPILWSIWDIGPLTPKRPIRPKPSLYEKKTAKQEVHFRHPIQDRFTDLGCGKEEWKRHSFSHTEVTFQNSSYQGDPLQSQHDQDFFLIYLNQLMVF